MLDEGPDGGEETRRLRLLIDRLPALIAYWDADLHNVIANEAHREYFGLGPAEIRGRHLRDLLGAESYELTRPYVEGALAGEEQLFERTLVDVHGRTRFTQTSYVPDIVDGRVRGFYVQVTDVTGRVQAERARDEAVRLFEISMANAPFGMATLTPAGRALYVNPALCELIGYTQEELSGVNYRDHLHPDDLAASAVDYRALVEGRVPQFCAERRYLRRDGSTIWMQISAVLVRGTHDTEDMVVAQFQDVTARRKAEAELARRAVTDPLTGLSNRNELITRIEAHRATRAGAPLGVVFLDLDGFKQVNDAHGHAVGDAVLTQVAGRLKSTVAEPNSVYRLGGDEFVILVPDAQESHVEGVARDICTGLTGDYDAGGAPVRLTASVGWTCGSDDVDELVRRADANMYRHKARLRTAPEGSDTPVA